VNSATETEERNLFQRT